MNINELMNKNINFQQIIITTQISVMRGTFIKSRNRASPFPTSISSTMIVYKLTENESTNAVFS